MSSSPGVPASPASLEGHNLLPACWRHAPLESLQPALLYIGKEHALEHLPPAVEVPGGVDSHEDGEHHEHEGHAPHEDGVALILLAPVFVGMRRHPCTMQGWLSRSCATGTYAVAQLRQGIGLRQCVSHCVLVSKRAPKSAAEMLPMVTDMFIQCRNVLSLAAHEAQTQAHQSFAPSLSWAHQ